MHWQSATEADLPALIGHLRRNEAGSMFPLANLQAEGLSGGGSNAMRVWLCRAGDDSGMVGLTRGGMLMPMWPHAGWGNLSAVLAGVRVEGAIGPSAQVRGMLAALGLGAVATRHDADEPGFVLALADLQIPEGTGTLHPVSDRNRAEVEVWRAAYLVEVMGLARQAAPGQAAQDVAGWIARGSHRLLMQGDAPLALTGFNATLPDVVQVGGVYVPPGARGRGLGRQAVALHLAEARATGVARAVLFAVSEAAARSYRAIGFQRHCTMALVLFLDPQVLK